MKLVMCVGNEIIAALPVEKALLSQPGYVSQLKRTLLQQYADTFLLDTEPEFLLVYPS